MYNRLTFKIVNIQNYFWIWIPRLSSRQITIPFSVCSNESIFLSVHLVMNLMMFIVSGRVISLMQQTRQIVLSGFLLAGLSDEFVTHCITAKIQDVKFNKSQRFEDSNYQQADTKLSKLSTWYAYQFHAFSYWSPTLMHCSAEKEVYWFKNWKLKKIVNKYFGVLETVWI